MTGVNAIDRNQQRRNWETAAAKHFTHSAHHMLELQKDRQGRERDTQAIHQCCFIKIFIHTMLLYVGSDPGG